MTTSKKNTATATAIAMEAPPSVEGLHFMELLGEGGFGRVWKARRSGNSSSSSSSPLHELVAVKTMRRPLSNTSAAQSLQREVEVWRFLSQSASRLPSADLMPVVRMLGLHATSDGQQICISMQLCNGGTLAHVLRAGPLDESRAMPLSHTLARGLHMCHSLRVLHLDMKPENVLFPWPACSDTCRGALVADFGLSQFLPSDASFIRKGRGAGTLGYQAPEVLTHGIYSAAADSWSLGALLLEALTGHLPPHDESGDDLIAEFEQWATCHGVSPSWVDDYMLDVWSCPRWAALSPAAKDAIRGLLCPNPSYRLTPLQLLHHPWLESEQILHQHHLTTLLPMAMPSAACSAAMAELSPALLHAPTPRPPGFA